MKVKVSTEILTDGQVIRSEKLGILEDGMILKFTESDTKVILNMKEHTMVRENCDMRLKYTFLENGETLNDVWISDVKLFLSLAIFTKEIKMAENSYGVRYHLMDEGKDVEYHVSWEEVK